MAMPVYPFGVYGLPPVGILTISDRTAARLPTQGSKAIGLGRGLFLLLLTLVTSSLRPPVELFAEPMHGAIPVVGLPPLELLRCCVRLVRVEPDDPVTGSPKAEVTVELLGNPPWPPD